MGNANRICNSEKMVKKKIVKNKEKYFRIERLTADINKMARS